MSIYLKQVREAVRATAFHSPTTFSWFGQRSPQLPPKIRRALTPKVARDFLLYNLQSTLYNNFYCRGFAAPPAQDVAESTLLGLTPFVEELSRANAGGGYWADGWQVREVRDGMATVHRGDLELRARPKECLPLVGGSIEPGANVSLRFPKELLGISPGFYMALSDRDFPAGDPQRLVRFYWNVTPEGAARLMQIVTSALNRAALPYRLKVLNAPGRFIRCDAAVLYVRPNDYAPVAGLLEDIYPDILGRLKPAVPAFTKLLAPGLGLAEDPGGEESFGQQRCRLLAEGMVMAHEVRERSVEGRVQVVVQHCADKGISLDLPYLNPGSADIYGFKAAPATSGSAAAAVAGQPLEAPGEDAYLETAARIGRRIVEEAVWYEERCNWVGAEMGDPRARNGQGLAYKALGPDLYAGTSGIALFLAELCAATRDSGAGRTAMGAIRHALSRLEVLPGPQRRGLYTGWLGIALSAARVGLLLDEDGLLHEALRLVERYAQDEYDEPEHEHDLIAGSAGALLACLSIHEVRQHPMLLSLAAQLGDELLGSAERGREGFSWKTPSFRTARNLTGFSHGTAGIGYALAELYRVTGESSYREGAEGAFAYERHWFSPEEGNWPDFREQAGRGREGRRALPHATFWCHGAPGIALSRLHAWAALRDVTYRDEALIALDTTRKATEALLLSGTGNYSLCHGLAGNAEVLLLASDLLDQGGDDHRTLALKAARAGTGIYGEDRRPWPCGVGGETPGLMTGWAGTGLFYLRLHDPFIPSALLLRTGREVREPVPA